MSDEKSSWLDEPTGEEYRLVEVPTNHLVEQQEMRRKEVLYEPLPVPKKVKVVDVWTLVKLPFSFVSLTLAFWLALNLTSIVEDGDVANWFKNWAANTQDSVEGYFGSGQVATYDGIFENKADWVGNNSSGEAIQILESEFFPFGESEEFPLVIERINLAFDEKRCAVLYSEYLIYKAIVSSDLANGYPLDAADVVMSYALDKYDDLKCVVSSEPNNSSNEVSEDTGVVSDVVIEPEVSESIVKN